MGKNLWLLVILVCGLVAGCNSVGNQNANKTTTHLAADHSGSARAMVRSFGQLSHALFSLEQPLFEFVDQFDQDLQQVNQPLLQHSVEGFAFAFLTSLTVLHDRVEVDDQGNVVAIDVAGLDQYYDLGQWHQPDSEYMLAGQLVVSQEDQTLNANQVEVLVADQSLQLAIGLQMNSAQDTSDDGLGEGTRVTHIAVGEGDHRIQYATSQTSTVLVMVNGESIDPALLSQPDIRKQMKHLQVEISDASIQVGYLSIEGNLLLSTEVAFDETGQYLTSIGPGGLRVEGLIRNSAGGQIAGAFELINRQQNQLQQVEFGLNLVFKENGGQQRAVIGLTGNFEHEQQASWTDHLTVNAQVALQIDHQLFNAAYVFGHQNGQLWVSRVIISNPSFPETHIRIDPGQERFTGGVFYRSEQVALLYLDDRGIVQFKFSNGEKIPLFDPNGALDMVPDTQLGTESSENAAPIF